MNRHRNEGSGAVTANGWDEVLSLIPFGIGYHPEECVILQLIDASRRSTGVTSIELVDDPGQLDRIAAHTAVTIEKQRPDHAVIICYCDRDDPAARKITDVLTTTLGAAGVHVLGPAIVSGDRWWLADDPADSPGNPYRPTDTVVAAEAALAGFSAMSGRQAVRDAVAQVTGDDLAAMEEVTRAEAERLLEEEQLSASEPVLPERLIERGISLTQEVRAHWADTGTLPDDATVARLSLLASHCMVYEKILLAMDEEKLRGDAPQDEHDLWRYVARRSIFPFRTGPLLLTAYSAWLSGFSELALAALDQVEPLGEADHAVVALMGVLIATDYRDYLALKRQDRQTGQAEEPGRPG